MSNDETFKTNYTYLPGVDYTFASLDRNLTGEECETFAQKYFHEHKRMTLPGEALFVDLRPAFRKPLADITSKFHAPISGVMRQRVGQPFIADSNRVNSRGTLPAMTTLRKWADAGDIKLVYTEKIWAELKSSQNDKIQAAARELGALFGYSLDEKEEAEARSKIARIVFPNGLRFDSDRVDVDTIRIAQLWHAIVITNDGDSKTQPGGILGAKSRLHREIGVEVMRDFEAEKLVARLIRERDRMEIGFAAKEGREPAAWVRWELLHETEQS